MFDNLFNLSQQPSVVNQPYARARFLADLYSPRADEGTAKNTPESTNNTDYMLRAINRDNLTARYDQNARLRQMLAPNRTLG